MPAFVRTKSDEERWKKAKEAASKETSRGSEGFWKLSNYIFHKMGKTERDQRLADMAKSELEKSVKSPMHTGSQSLSVKIPKQKKLAGAFDKPSKFFKSENINPKHPSVQKLKDFLLNIHKE